ncbi:MAG: hypothetical protein FJW31_29490 [Acidobacteria bacterium]|nr:hypothetical protein [Acidobacteriota bacterium]
MELQLRLRDEANRPIAARLEVRGADGAMCQAEGALLSRRPGRGGNEAGSPYLRSFVVKGDCVVQLPAAGRYRVVAEHGLEYERVECEVEAPASITVQLKPWIRMRERGWWSGDMHVHRPVDDSPLLLEAEDLNLGVVFTMWNAQNIWAGRPSLPADWIRQTAQHRWMTVTNAEDERGGGAWLLHGLKEDLGLDRVVPAGTRANEHWNPPGIEFVRKARATRQRGQEPFPWFDLEKPISWEAPVMMALERPDSMGLLNNHYHQYGMYPGEAWGAPARYRALCRTARLFRPLAAPDVSLLEPRLAGAAERGRGQRLAPQSRGLQPNVRETRRRFQRGEMVRRREGRARPRVQRAADFPRCRAQES